MFFVRALRKMILSVPLIPAALPQRFWESLQTSPYSPSAPREIWLKDFVDLGKWVIILSFALSVYDHNLILLTM